MQITLECLREALAGKLGSVLTPELAAEIELAAHDRNDRALDPRQFKPEHWGVLTFQAESFRDIAAELHAQHADHYRETEKHLQGVAMQPDYAYMAEAERQGRLIQFTVRDELDKLAGNLRIYLRRSLHTGLLYADEDTFYLAPAYRRGMTALALLRYVEGQLVNVVKVSEIRANSKVVNNAHRLMEFRGYQHVANQYIKTFDRKE